MTKSALASFPALPANTSDAIAQEAKTVAANYKPLPVMLHRGEGLYLWDREGNKYLDMMSAYSAVSHGHSHPRIVAALTEQAKTLAMTSRAFYTDTLAPFAQKLCTLAGLDMMLPMNTGAEAIETAIKAARLWGYRDKKIADNKAEIIVANGNFHGRTTTIVSFSSEADYKKDFGPFTPGFVMTPYGDIDAIEKAITPNTCAVLLEPIQGEAGIVTPPQGFLKALRALCDAHNVLLVLDEVQSGLGRTGKTFCFQHEGITPDLLILGKALGGGLLPVSAVVGKHKVLGLFKPGSHGSTFGGNPLACRVGYEALCVLEDEQLVDNSAKLGAYMKAELEKIGHPAIRAVRGKGLWIGVDFDPAKVAARTVCEKLMTRGILSKETHDTVVRFAPPLTITQAEIDFCLGELKAVLQELNA